MHVGTGSLIGRRSLLFQSLLVGSAEVPKGLSVHDLA